MFKKIICLFFIVTAVFTYTFSYSPAMAEEDGDDSFILLKDGDTGDYVIQVQYRLKDLGYFNYKITNYYGSYTTQTVRNFQEVNNLPADGVLGPETASILFSNEAKRRPVEEVKKPEPKENKPSVPVGALRDWFKYVYPAV